MGHLLAPGGGLIAMVLFHMLIVKTFYILQVEISLSSNFLVEGPEVQIPIWISMDFP